MTFVPYRTHPRDEEEVLFRTKKIIKDTDWVETTTQKGDGGVGNTFEHLIGIEQNSDRGADAGNYEIKTNRASSPSEVNFAFAPFPRTESQASRLLEKFGWAHGSRDDEQGFYTRLYHDWNGRGFRLDVDRSASRVYVKYNSVRVSGEFKEWNSNVPNELDPSPYWEFADLRERVAETLANVIYVTADSRETATGTEEFNYQSAELWLDHTFEKFLDGLESDHIAVEFQIRSGKDYGTRFIIPSSFRRNLYNDVVSLNSTNTGVDYTKFLNSVRDLQETAEQLESVTDDVTEQVEVLVQNFTDE